MLRKEHAEAAENEDEFLDTADQEKVIADLRLQNAQSARTYAFVFCLGALAHCLFTLYLLLQHPFKVSELPDNAMTLLLLSGVACSAHVAYSSQAIMRLPQRLAHGKLLGECTPSCSFSFSSRAWAFINAALWALVGACTQVPLWDASGSLCISLAPVAITFGLHSLSNSTVKFDRSIDSLEGGKYEFKKL